MNRAQDVFDRISKGIFYNKNLKIYTKEYLNSILSELEKYEDFEKCDKLKSFIESRFSHKNNYKSPIL